MIRREVSPPARPDGAALLRVVLFVVAALLVGFAFGLATHAAVFR